MLLRMLIGLGFLPLVASIANGADPVRVRILSYNIHHAEGTDGKLDLARVGKIISSVQPDLVALQEIDFKTDRTRRIDQAAELARQTGLYFASGPNIDFQNGQYGTAILSRWKIASQKNHPLPNFGAEQRGVLLTEIQVENGPRLHFLGTHLDHRGDERERIESAVFINKLADTLAGPALLAGDLNAVPTSETISLLEKSWVNPTASKPLFTIPSKEPRRQIDYVMYRPAERWRMVEARVLDEAVASDHRPLLVVLEWDSVK